MSMNEVNIMASATHTENRAEAVSALDYAREQGRLSGEVRVLKWAVGTAFVALIAVLGAIYAEMNQGFRDVNQRFQAVNRQFQGVNRQFRDVNRQFQDMSRRIGQLTHSVTEVRERLTRIEGRLDRSGAVNENPGRHSTLDSNVPPSLRGRGATPDPSGDESTARRG